MQNSRLLLTLSSLDKPEWRDFQKYLRSPFFNRRSDVIALAVYLQKELSKPGDAQRLTKATVWAKICPQSPYDEKQLRYTMSYLLDRAESYLALVEMQSDSSARSLFVVNALRKRGLEKNADAQLITAPPTKASDRSFDPAIQRSLQSKLREMRARTEETPAPRPPENMAHFTI